MTAHEIFTAVLDCLVLVGGFALALAIIGAICRARYLDAREELRYKIPEGPVSKGGRNTDPSRITVRPPAPGQFIDL